MSPRKIRLGLAPGFGLLITSLLASGCVGPMACGPVGHAVGHGPLTLGHRAVGGECDSGCNGCGERYIDEWVNHPPSCTDPCDSCGNYNGQSCHACRPFFRGFISLWGYRCDPPPVGCDRVACEPTCGISGCDGGCRDCRSTVVMDGHVSPGHPVHTYEDSVEFDSFEQHDGPTLVGPLRGEGAPAVRPPHPGRQRQIFRQRDTTASAPRPYPNR